MQQLIGISKITIRFFLPGFLFLILAGGPSYAGKIDSLKRTLQETDQLTHLKTLIEISNAYRKANPDSSYAYAQKALKLSGNQKYWSERLSAFDNLSTFFWDTREYDSSLLMLDSAIILSYKQTSDNDVAYFENSKGYRYWHMGMFPQALE
nr:hypothetical protein [Bacteroidota bacterium]